MNAKTQTLRVLGLAFLFQFFTSLISSAVILPRASGISAMGGRSDIGEALVRVASHPGLMRANVLGEMATAMGIVLRAPCCSSYCGRSTRERHWWLWASTS